jgi:hypothetical protein
MNFYLKRNNYYKNIYFVKTKKKEINGQLNGIFIEEKYSSLFHSNIEIFINIFFNIFFIYSKNMLLIKKICFYKNKKVH